MNWSCAFCRPVWARKVANEAKRKKVGAQAKKRPPKHKRSGLLRRLLLWRRQGVALMVVVSVIALIGAAVAKLRDPHTLPIRTVVVEGELRHLNRERLVERAAPHVSGGFFSLRLGKAEHVLESLPWVHRVSLRRRWPDTLVIHVHEQVPIAYWGEQALLNRHGERFAPPKAEFPEGLPRLEGPDGKERELIERFLDFDSQLSRVGLQLMGLSKDRREAWHLELAGGIRLALGRGADTHRLERFLAAYPAALAHEAGRIARIDLRYTNGFAVAWRAGAQPAGGE